MPHPLAGQPAPRSLLIDPAAVERAYYEKQPDPENPLQAVAFGTSGHRGSPLDGTFTDAHIAAITQAVIEYRAAKGFTGPLFVGRDTHAASTAAQRTALEVLSAHDVPTLIAHGDLPTPTPAVSLAILNRNRKSTTGLADGLILTPSHNPPADGGMKYNPPHGGPADSDATSWIEGRANELLRAGTGAVKRTPLGLSTFPPNVRPFDFRMEYIRHLDSVIDFDVIRASELRIGVDPLGGASVDYWEPIAQWFRCPITVVNTSVDPTFSFMRVDHDGKLRMDCSSPHAMAGLVELRDKFDIAFGSDPDADRHGIVTRSAGLMNANHYLAAAIDYLLAHRPGWPAGASIGKTVVSSGLIDRVVAAAGRRLNEVPVGFKYFAQGLYDGTFCFGGEESAGASFLRKDGSVWTTDKDGILLCLLAAEMTARTGKDPGELFQEITKAHGTPHYTRIDAPATLRQKAALKKLTPAAVTATELAGEKIIAKLTNAPGNNAPIGGLKVVTENGWFAARPSGTENLYKLYAESFRGADHLKAIVTEAQELIQRTLG